MSLKKIKSMLHSSVERSFTYNVIEDFYLLTCAVNEPFEKGF